MISNIDNTVEIHVRELFYGRCGITHGVSGSVRIEVLTEINKGKHDDNSKS